VLAIDPGTHQSAWVFLIDGEPESFGIHDNEWVLSTVGVYVRMHVTHPLTVVIENVESFGMAVGAEVFETVRWAGRFEQAAQPAPVVRIGRKAVKVALCGSMKAKDPNIRQAVIDRFGGSAAIKKGGVLFGASKDVWAALAVGLTYLDGLRERAA
jgi:hypothetical protein